MVEKTKINLLNEEIKYWEDKLKYYLMVDAPTARCEIARARINIYSEIKKDLERIDTLQTTLKTIQNGEDPKEELDLEIVKLLDVIDFEREEKKDLYKINANYYNAIKVLKENFNFELYDHAGRQTMGIMFVDPRITTFYINAGQKVKGVYRKLTKEEYELLQEMLDIKGSYIEGKK